MSDIGPITVAAGGQGQGAYAITGGGGGGEGVPLQHVWYPATEVGIMTTPQRLVRVWHRDWTYMLQLAPDSGALAGEMFTATLPVDHELAAHLRTGARPNFLTVDEAGLRWVGRLHEWKILKAVRNGGCSECEHCQERVMEIVWVKPPKPTPMPLAAFT